MPAKSKSQQRFMGMVNQCKKTGKCASSEVEKAAGSMKSSDVKKFASTKHKGLPEKVTEKKITFKDFLMEFDIGDQQLQQQATQQANQQQQQAAADQQARGGAFADNMGGDTPSKGDVIESKQGRFVVVGGSMQGIVVKQLGGDGGGTIPHGTKFKNMGQGESGKTVFSVIPQAVN